MFLFWYFILHPVLFILYITLQHSSKKTLHVGLGGEEVSSGSGWVLCVTVLCSSRFIHVNQSTDRKLQTCWASSEMRVCVSSGWLLWWVWNTHTHTHTASCWGSESVVSQWAAQSTCGSVSRLFLFHCKISCQEVIVVTVWVSDYFYFISLSSGHCICRSVRSRAIFHALDCVHMKPSEL